MAESATTTNHVGEDHLVPDVSLADLLNSSNNPAFAAQSSETYLSHLTTLPLETLLSEPTLLQTQSHHLTSSLTSLTHTSYPTFLSLHGTTKALTESLSSLSSSLDSLITTSLPGLEQSAAGWRERTDDVLNERRKARIVLEQHDKLRDLLDIPLLIDTCVRNGYFSEALSLAAEANSLSASSSSSGTPLILTSLLSEVHHSMTQMLFSLLATLHEPNRKLPALWKAVNFLRKMDAFELDDGVQVEEQLAIAFITGRESCLKSSLEGIRRDITRLAGLGAGELAARDKEDLTRFLKKYIEIWREGVYDIITQYSTIFLERPASSSSSSKASAVPTSPPPPSLHILLSTYASHALQTHLLPILTSTMPLIPLPSLPSLLTQLTYCATAFGRVGMDFRGILSTLFSNAVLSGVNAEIKDATTKWIGILKEKTGSESVLSPSMSSAKRKTNLTIPSKFLIASSAIASPPTPAHAVSSPSSIGPPQPQVPPQVLSSYPPLAEYTNALLSTFNNLRLLAPVSILPDLQLTVDASLSKGALALFTYIKRAITSDNTERERQNDKERAGGEQEERIALAAGQVYFEVFVPFVRRAVGEGVYGVQADYTVTMNDKDDEDEEEEGKDALDGDVRELEVAVGSQDENGLAPVVREWEAWLEKRREIGSGAH